MTPIGLLALSAAALALTACVAHPWDNSIQQQALGLSKSPVEAPLQPIRMVKPHPGMLEDRAQWWGLWQGWLGQDRSTDVKIVFSHITDDKAFIQYSWADAKQRGSIVLWGQFKDGGVEGSSRSIGTIQLRLRASGDVMEIRLLDMHEGNTLVKSRYGVLTRQPTPDKEFLTNN